uniref:Suppressor of cytokine signaling 2 n=1 Tax=Dromaius novaehollandiae TaxID=8790 RepID=A0A8C4JZQ8_DRONO
MSVAEAKERLQDAPEGTFLVRDSSHSEYLLTISVKTSAGPTNLRIEYQDGKFRLDSITCVRSRLKQFNSVVHLIEYYVLMCKDRTETPSNGTVHLYLNKPLYTSAPSLQHRCRITINKCTNQIWELPLPTRLKEYLKEYQYQQTVGSSSHTVASTLRFPSQESSCIPGMCHNHMIFLCLSSVLLGTSTQELRSFPCERCQGDNHIPGNAFVLMNLFSYSFCLALPQEKTATTQNNFCCSKQMC